GIIGFRFKLYRVIPDHLQLDGDHKFHIYYTIKKNKTQIYPSKFDTSEPVFEDDEDLPDKIYGSLFIEGNPETMLSGDGFNMITNGASLDLSVFRYFGKEEFEMGDSNESTDIAASVFVTHFGGSELVGDPLIFGKDKLCDVVTCENDAVNF